MSSFNVKLARIDYTGIAIFTAATCAFLIGITTGGTVHPWSSASVLAPLIIGFVLYCVFIIVEWKLPKEPMIPLRVFNDRSAATAGFLTAFTHGLVLWCYTYYMIVFVRSISLLPDSLDVFHFHANSLSSSAPCSMGASAQRSKPSQVQLILPRLPYVQASLLSAFSAFDPKSGPVGH